jgi:hypothetical protein
MVEYAFQAICERQVMGVQPVNRLALRIRIYMLERRSLLKIADTQSPWIISSEMEIIPTSMDIRHWAILKF